METWPCPLCGDPAAEPVWQVVNRRRAESESLIMVRCHSCGLFRQAPRSRQLEKEGFPAATQPRIGLDRWSPARQTWLQWMAAGRPGPMDIGWPRFVAAWLAHGKMLAPRARRQPLAFAGEGSRLLLVDAGRLDASADLFAGWGWQVDKVGTVAEAAGTYDVVYFAAGLERMTDPLAALRAVRERLNLDGVLVAPALWADGLLARLAGVRWARLDLPAQAVLFVKPLLAAAARAAGLRVAAMIDASQTSAWLQSMAPVAGGAALVEGTRKVARNSWLNRLLSIPVWVLDVLGAGDRGFLIAVRDDRLCAGWSPRERPGQD